MEHAVDSKADPGCATCTGEDLVNAYVRVLECEKRLGTLIPQGKAAKWLHVVQGQAETIGAARPGVFLLALVTASFQAYCDLDSSLNPNSQPQADGSQGPKCGSIEFSFLCKKSWSRLRVDRLYFPSD